jgi:hypothetical protein
VDLLERDTRDEAIARLDRVETAPAEDRKALLRTLRTAAEDPSLSGRLADESEPLFDYGRVADIVDGTA